MIPTPDPLIIAAASLLLVLPPRQRMA